MPVYKVDPCDWGEHWTVLAKNRKDALKYIKEFILNDELDMRSVKERKDFFKRIEDDIKNNVNPKGINGEGYTMIEYGEGVVIDGEYS